MGAYREGGELSGDQVNPVKTQWLLGEESSFSEASLSWCQLQSVPEVRAALFITEEEKYETHTVYCITSILLCS